MNSDIIKSIKPTIHEHWIPPHLDATGKTARTSNYLNCELILSGVQCVQIGRFVHYAQVQSVKDEFRIAADKYLIDHHGVTLSEVKAFIEEADRREVMIERLQAGETEYLRWIRITEHRKG